MADTKRAMALGFFDGVHIGHAALLNKTKQRAEEIGAMPSVLTFDIHPDTLVFGTEVPLINSAIGRKDIINRCFGIDNVVFIHFNQKVMRMDWHEFIDELIEELGIAWLVVGHDFCFGYKGLGTAPCLKEYCAEKGIGCDIIEPVCRDGIVVSSTEIRKLIQNGEIEKANELLGHPHMLSDTVRSGYHLGTKMGTPTINRYRRALSYPATACMRPRSYLMTVRSTSQSPMSACAPRSATAALSVSRASSWTLRATSMTGRRELSFTASCVTSRSLTTLPASASR